ncbi:MAG TPA: discoidin domain-containing protein [Dongiaceae bacterium]|nr:discoidin domain-containing protein [Dongiaceae bacterium]
MITRHDQSSLISVASENQSWLRGWRMISSMGAVALLCLAARMASAGEEPPRRSVSLDGTWEIAEGKMDQVPGAFERTVPVPGLVSLARPAFDDPPGPKVAERNRVPQKDPKRDAFWYRRVFRLEQAAPAVALVKVHKAMFGTRVLLNGAALGDHLPSFTPGYFNAKSALKVGENELLIRVGADRDAVGPAIPSGFDYEKERYIPGIFDSVELILCGTPHFTQVQAVPEVGAGAVRVQAVLRNEGEATLARGAFTVREAKSGREAGRLATEPLSLAKGAERTVEVRIPIAGCHLWSPEDPFLYTLEADSGTDRVQTRFGMREFRFDPGTGRAMLNGKPYFMRGSNFTLYRFFEDAESKDLPWRKDWVLLLHQRVKEMRWNCLRYCIGFPPEAWYDIADEVGILIQDEFPLWHGGSGWSTWPKELKSEELAREYAEWMRERWNHPCVAVWDASNETASSETGPAIRKVRDLDLSHRPWDNSYTEPMDPGDVFESHPYHFNANFRLRDLASADPVPQGNQIHNDGKHAVIINEYGWHWVNRDGTPTTLTREMYRAVLGEQATAEQRFHMQAAWLAADTEFWRAHRKAAAVMHFTTLGYSRPDGQTCDHWKPGGVEKLQWEPEFYRYAREAFAPVGLSVEYWKDKNLQRTDSRVPVMLINDLEQPWSGAVTLRLRQAGAEAPVAELKREASLEPYGQRTLDFQLAWPGPLGQYTLEAELRGADGQTARSARELEVIDRSALGLAYQKLATASSSQAKEYLPANAVDGDPGTYWSSTFADPAWLAVDLGEMRKISHVRITWERAYSKEFAVQVSRDGQNWTDVSMEANGKGGVSDIRFPSAEARHVRISCTKRGTQWGHAIRELEVFE